MAGGPRCSRTNTSRIRTDALLVRVAPFGEADMMVSVFTEEKGMLSAVARSGRRSSRRFSALEPMHRLRLGLEERAGSDVAFLVESALARPRLRLCADLDRLDAAGRALRWIRRAAPHHTPEPALWAEINAFLDALDGEEADAQAAPLALLAGAGLRMLGAVGWGLDLERCVRCSKGCASGASAYVDPAEGGLVCRSCGGGSVILRGARRVRLLAASNGEPVSLDADDVRTALDLVEASLTAHA